MTAPAVRPTERAGDDAVLCPCSGTRVAQILALLAQGHDDAEQISRITGAGSGCGGCEYELCQLLTVAKEREGD